MTYDIRRAMESIKAEDTLIASTSRYLSTCYDEELSTRRRVARRPRAWSAVGAVCMMLLIFVLYHVWLVPDIYISVDINPSIELVLNRAGRVLESYPYNADAEALLDTLALRGQTAERAIGALVEAFDASGYLVKGNDVTLTVYAQRVDPARLCGTYEQAVQTELAKRDENLGVSAVPVDASTHAHAHQHGMSAAKYLALMELLDVDDTATFEDYRENSLGEIRERTEWCMGMHGEMNGGTNNHGRGGRHHNR